nr:MAG TPA: hypothetical protein [Caudoviricetes sp.]
MFRKIKHSFLYKSLKIMDEIYQSFIFINIKLIILSLQIL